MPLRWLWALLILMFIPFFATLSRGSYLAMPFVYMTIAYLRPGKRVQMIELAGDPERRRQMGEAGRRRAPEYGVEQMVIKIEALYEEVLAEKGLGL
jgi:hypothetical protein